MSNNLLKYNNRRALKKFYERYHKIEILKNNNVISEDEYKVLQDYILLKDTNKNHFEKNRKNWTNISKTEKKSEPNLDSNNNSEESLGVVKVLLRIVLPILLAVFIGLAEIKDDSKIIAIAVIIVFIFIQPIDKVWKAITEADQISRWFINADFKMEKGYQYTFTATEEHDGTQIKGEVLEVDPYTLKYTWEVEGTGMHTTVSWTLEEEEGKTKLILVHSGISQFGEQGVEMMGHFDKGWDACLNVLPNYLNNEATEPAH